jgi:UDP-N-acetylglucosamine transferase subunit ALG13
VIFVTIGSMFPFDRMIREMDAWAAARPAGEDAEEILAQIGDGAYEPQHMNWVRRLDRSGYLATVDRARLIVAHAGVGSVVSAGEKGKPIVVLPRREGLGEHTSDHQVETAGWLKGKTGVHVAGDETELAARIAEASDRSGDVAAMPAIDPAFVARLRAFILDGPD